MDILHQTMTTRIPTTGVADIRDTRRKKNVLWSRFRVERMAHGWLVYAGILYVGYFCRHYLADFQTSISASPTLS
jgi:hypothetical protein